MNYQQNQDFIKTETATFESCLYNKLTERIKTRKRSKELAMKSGQCIGVRNVKTGKERKTWRFPF